MLTIKEKEYRKKIQKQFYITKSKEVLILNQRISHLSNKVDLMIHYWKKRCKERKTYKFALKKLIQKGKKFDNLERNIRKSFNKYLLLRPESRDNKSKEPMYPLFVTKNELQRLRRYFQRKKDLIKRPEHGKSFIALNINEKQKLRNLLKRKNEKRNS